MAGEEEEYLLISGLQHFSFCRRQWALIHLEQQWAENRRTAEGQLDHARCHDDTLREKRGDLLTVRGMRVISHRLRLTGCCDVVEFRADPGGVSLREYPGLWLPIPVEYKHGRAKLCDADRLQLCAQAMALEEMLVCEIPCGALYYAETRQRETVALTSELRAAVQQMAEEMNILYARGYTPKSRPGKHCNACSLKDLCVPKLCGRLSAGDYIQSRLEEAAKPDTEVPPCDDF